MTPQDRNKDRVVRYARNHIPIGTGKAFVLDDPGQLVSQQPSEIMLLTVGHQEKR